ncbi:DUF1345 domain-containing protein [Dokdonella soli]|uniref:DUF1345 domain-containing protein n=1 Tax=Dokdonella soli TaxID=529810 RepID=A0ABN1IEN8_9GAMM
MPEAPSKPAQPGIGTRFVRRLTRRPRFNIAATLFVALVVALRMAGIGPTRVVVLAFVLASLVFLGLVAQMFTRSDVASIRARSRKEDQGRWGFLLSGVAVTAVALVALGMELHAGKTGGAPQIALAAASLLLSWLFMNTMFALHYAHAYYGDNQRQQPRGGLEFPGQKEPDYWPDYWDFAYFAIVIGMTFQVSDVQITDRRLRHIALVHSVIAFFFNVVIIALSVNIVAGTA